MLLAGDTIQKVAEHGGYYRYRGHYYDFDIYSGSHGYAYHVVVTCEHYEKGFRWDATVPCDMDHRVLDVVRMARQASNLAA